MGRHHGEVCGERDILGATTVKFVGQMACVLRLKAPSRPRTYTGSSKAPGAIPNPRAAVCGSAQPCKYYMVGQWMAQEPFFVDILGALPWDCSKMSMRSWECAQGPAYKR